MACKKESTIKQTIRWQTLEYVVWEIIIMTVY